MNATDTKASGAAVYSSADTFSKPFDEAGLLGSNQQSVVASWADCITALESFRSLEDDWDGDGAAAPTADLIDVAISLANSLRAKRKDAPDRVHVGVNGTIFFELFEPRGYCEIEVVNPDQIEGRFVLKGATTAQTFAVTLG